MFANQLGIVYGVRGVRHGIGDLGDIRRAANCFKDIGLLQLVNKQSDVDLATAFVHVEHLLVENPMSVVIKIIRTQDHRDFVTNIRQ